MAIIAGMTPRRDSQKNVSLICGVDTVSGDLYPFARDPVTGGIVTSLAAVVVTTTPAVPTSGNTFNITLTGGAVSVSVCAANAASRGKKVTNASAQGGAAGFDMWVSFQAGNAVGVGDWIPPGGFATFQGREAIFASSSGACAVTVSEEYT